MLYFHIEKGEALVFLVSVKNSDKVCDIWYRLMKEHKQFPLDILKVVPNGIDSNILEISVSLFAAEKTRRFLYGLGCFINSERMVETARPILASSGKEVVVLPAITGVFDSSIEYE